MCYVDIAEIQIEIWKITIGIYTRCQQKDKINSSVKKIYILRPNRDQSRKMQLQGLRLDPGDPWCTLGEPFKTLGVLPIYWIRSLTSERNVFLSQRTFARNVKHRISAVHQPFIFTRAQSHFSFKRVNKNILILNCLSGDLDSSVITLFHPRS